MKAIQFYNNLTKTLKENLGSEWTMELDTDVVRNNGTNRIALILYKNGDKLHPQIYLERFFEDYKRGKSMEEILQDVKTTYEEALQGFNPDNLFGIENWEQVKGRLALRLISKERNRKTLENYVYGDFLDLAAIVTFCVEIDQQGVKAIRVTHDLAKQWDISEPEILRVAKENTEKLFPARIESILDSLCRALGITKEELLEKAEIPLQTMVLCNNLGVNGATVLLPSRIHEIIVVALDSAPSFSRCQEMVESINRNYVDEEEILSDSVYLYDGEKVILVCDSKGVCHNEEKLD